MPRSQGGRPSLDCPIRYFPKSRHHDRGTNGTGEHKYLGLLPFPEHGRLANRCRLARDNGFVIDVYRTTDLSPLLRIARTVLLSKRLRRRGPEH